jgi:hypothetical protein
LSSPLATPERIVNAIVAARRMYPGWGARKLHALMVCRVPRQGSFHVALDEIPCSSTIGAILRREGLM